MSFDTEADTSLDVAVVGMAGRFPGADDVDDFWRLLADEREGLRRFTRAELEAAGEWEDSPAFVPVRGTIADPECFDAELFGVSARDAVAIDPQHRVFLECAWSALESAGFAPRHTKASVGVYAGTSANTYLFQILPWLREHTDAIDAVMHGDKDFLATRVAYKLDLRGPAITVQTACSTSLVAVHLACQALLAGDCDMALAGGVTVRFPHVSGYEYVEGSIAAPDGHCRAFDHRAAGTVGGSGVGAVVLMRLDQAIAERATILGVIRASAVNNDGAAKVGFTAPSVAGQARVVRAALETAGLAPENISYVECHGTGTRLGDPIEVAALREVFASAPAGHRCGIGSVKSNIGHLDTAAGVASLIKVLLAMRHRTLPASLHVESVNPELLLGPGPLHVNAKTTAWNASTLRAGVSSFGIGGTNAHVVLEEAPASAVSPCTRGHRLFVWSARTAESVAAAVQRSDPRIAALAGGDRADAAYTLAVGREQLRTRAWAVLPSHGPEASIASRVVHAPASVGSAPPVAFVFSGQGTQYFGMASGLYENEPVFREEVDACARELATMLDVDLRDIVFRRTGTDAGSGKPTSNVAAGERPAEDVFTRTDWVQPALFVVEYALARWFMRLGLTPSALIGHSVGEYVAACIAGVFSRRDALRLVVERGRLMAAAPPGAMCAVELPETAVRELLSETTIVAALDGKVIEIAAVNGPRACVVGGEPSAVEALVAELTRRGVAARRLPVGHAFHTRMMDDAIEPFVQFVASVSRSRPSLRIMANGTWLAGERATDPSYWGEHLREPVLFAAGIQALREELPGVVFVELGPGRSVPAAEEPAPAAPPRTVGAASVSPDAIATCRRPRDARSDSEVLLAAVGELWGRGVDLDLAALYAGEARRRVPLPTYAFARERYSAIEAAPRSGAFATQAAPADVPSPLQVTVVRKPRPALETPFVALETEVEEQVAAVWGEVLGVTGFGADDNFFELGGDSLSLVRLRSRLNERFAIDVTLARLNDSPTIADQAYFVELLVIEQLEQLEQQQGA